MKVIVKKKTKTNTLSFFTVGIIYSTKSNKEKESVSKQHIQKIIIIQLTALNKNINKIMFDDCPNTVFTKHNKNMMK